MTTYNFSKKSRISTKDDFKAVLGYKLFGRNELMTLYMAVKSAAKPRFAVSISAKTAPAAVRNRLKRLAREAFRLSQNEIADSFDYFVIYSARLLKKTDSDIKKITLSEVRQGFLELAEQGRRRFEKKQNK